MMKAKWANEAHMTEVSSQKAMEEVQGHRGARIIVCQGKEASGLKASE